MQLPLHLKNRFYIFIFISLPLSSLASQLEVESIEVPECPASVTVSDGEIIDASGWDYSIQDHLIDPTTKKMKDGVLKSDFAFPEVTHINTYTNSVTGGLSSDTDEITASIESYTWDIQKINKHSQAVFYCDFHGDRNETPVQFVYLYKKIPSDIKTCTVTYKLENDTRTPEGQTLECYH